jgi:hypothetical protein
LVALAEGRQLSTVFTLDRRDFAVFRVKKRRLYLPDICFQTRYDRQTQIDAAEIISRVLPS